ncbi:hypothetical protein COCON_G00218600 [Conger conger]|uniref:Uncharacterized protein n=1 Tax=Conger conger TaxID=82655 RepID=A0A9Q1CYC9_CONCO|nr:hypothetical protein COCON_G00218600 [Conger conger]
MPSQSLWAMKMLHGSVADTNPVTASNGFGPEKQTEFWISLVSYLPGAASSRGGDCMMSQPAGPVDGILRLNGRVENLLDFTVKWVIMCQYN